MNREIVEIESVVLGALLIEKSVYTEEVMSFLKPAHFSVNEHRIVYRAIEVLKDRGAVIDIVTVAQVLREKKQIDRIGGPLFISKLTNRVASSANIVVHARMMFQEYINREIAQLSSNLLQRAGDGTDALELLSHAEVAIAKLKDGMYAGQDNMKPVKEILPEVNNAIESRLAGNMVGIPTGYSELDEVLFGWVKTDLIYVGGRPGMGKTSFMLSTAIILAEMGIPSAFFSLEMSAQQLVGRLISQIIDVSYQDIMLKKVDQSTLLRFHEMMGRIESLPIYIDDTPAIPISEIRRRSRKAVDKSGVQMIFADYAQLIRGTDSKSKNREQEVAEVSRGLKQCAKECNIPVMSAAQLGRGQAEKQKPTLKDFRESGSFEQDADVVIFPYRAEYYGIMEDEKGNTTEGKVEMIIAKHRNGGLGNPTMNFVSRLAKFESAQQQYNRPVPHPDQRTESSVRRNEDFLKDKEKAPF